MKRLLCAALALVFALCAFSGCSKGIDLPFTDSIMMVEWVDFVKVDGVSYEYNNNVEDADISEDLIGDLLGTVAVQVPSEMKESEYENYVSQDFSASFLPVGTEIYSVKNQSECVAVKGTDGTFTLYRARNTEKENISSTTNTTSTVSTTNSPIKTLKFSSDTVRVAIEDCDGIWENSCQIVQSAAELNAHFDDHICGFSLKAADGGKGVKDYVSHCDESFFKKNALVFVNLYEPSGSNSHYIESVWLNGKEINVDVARIVPEVGTCDIAMWTIIVTIPAGDYETAVMNVDDAVICSEPLQSSNFADSDMLTVEITEIGNGYFKGTHPWPSPLEYTIIFDLSENFKVGDFVDVKYKSESIKNTGDNKQTVTAYSVAQSNFEPDPMVAYKPVIYLYPEEKTNVSVKLNLDGKLTVSEPLYNDGWHVTAFPDGTIVNSDLTIYEYLFWEAELDVKTDPNEGFCVKGIDTKEFLEEKLTHMGLNAKERADFMEFWVPVLAKNNYNLITFAEEEYTEKAKLDIEPTPDTIIRIFMVYTPLEAPVEVKEQELMPHTRSGFTVVEWGGKVSG